MKHAHEKWGEKQKYSIYNFVQCNYATKVLVFRFSALWISCMSGGRRMKHNAEKNTL